MNRISTTWEAANVTRKSKKSSSSSPRRGGGNRSEADRATLEATLNRLSKAYNTAMECIGALHKADAKATSIESTEELDKKVDIIRQVSRVARRTFEEGILIDPLVGPQAAAVWTAGVQQQQQSTDGTQSISTWIRHLATPSASARPLLSSAAHERTVEQIAYLALVNYADLLWCACKCSFDKATMGDDKNSVLDRGIVKTLQTLSEIEARQNLCCCCWNKGEGENEEHLESPEQTLQSIVWALLDATALDGSDPVVWLKLACASRRLGLAQGDVYKYRLLERHALEQGVASRADVPNRLILRAYQEWNDLQDARWERECDILAPPLPTMIQRLEMPRYSWAVLGRMLLRACRGEFSSAFSQKSDREEHQTWCTTISLSISPLLALPVEAVMQTVVSFLDSKSFSQLKLVCRTLSMLRYDVTAINKTSVVQAPEAAFPVAASGAAASSSGAAAQNAAPPPESLTKVSKSISASSKESTQGSRVSKRLRSQMISTGRRAERSQRRSSIDYCLYAVVLGVAAPEKSTDQDINEKVDIYRHADGKKSGAGGTRDIIVKRTTLSEKDQRHAEALERIGPGSLSAFVSHFTNSSNAPLAVLFNYVAHVSSYIDQVCHSDHHGTLVLLSSVSDCLEVMLKRTQSYDGLIPSWSTGDFHVPAGAGLQADQIFAIDLLHAELRFKRFDREDHYVTEVDFNSDANVVEQLISALGRVLDQRLNVTLPTTVWNSLRVRFEWLVAGYYLWRSRISHDVAEQREAEREGLDCIKEIISFMETSRSKALSTPHLEGIGRSGDIWRELSIASLTTFQNKVQASSVVLKAQEQFIDAISNLVDTEEILTLDEMNRFASISSSLMKRYSSPVDSAESNYFELLDDFLGVHGVSIFSFSLEKGAPGLRQWFAKLVPTESVDREALHSMKEPCILSILMSCMQLQHGQNAQALHLILNLIRTIERFQRRFLESSKGGHQQLDDPQSDAMSDDFSLMSEDDAPDTGSLTGYGLLLGLLVETLGLLFEKSDFSTKTDFITSPDLPNVVEEIFKFCAGQPLSTGRASSGEDSETSSTFFILERVAMFMKTLEAASEEEGGKYQRKCLHLKGLVAVLGSQETSLKALLTVSAHQKARHSWKSQVTALGKDIGFVCLSLGEILSLNLASVKDAMISPSSVVDGANIHIERLCSTLLSLFHLSRSRFKDIGLQEFLRTPTAAAVVAFCGAAACTRADGSFAITLSDFVDSDGSATEWIEDEEDHEQTKYAQTLRVISQIVHVVQLAIGSLEERYLLRYVWLKNYVTEYGPLLPLISSRVLNFCADALLVEFPGEDSGVGLKSSIWSEYSVGTRRVGSLLDSLLHKVYRCLHGFNLSPIGEAKEMSLSASPNDSEPPSFLPEGVRAAAQLYRCVMRACAFGRKTPPKAALDAITAALPDIPSSLRAQNIRRFLFDAKSKKLDSKGLLSVVQKTAWESPFEELSGCFTGSGTGDEGKEVSVEDESSLVRQGIANLIAQGPLPQYQEAPDTDARVESATVEGELSRKFDAILFELSYGNISNCKNWVKAAQCCWSKSEMIADRLGRKSKFVRCPNFSVRGHIQHSTEGIALPDLILKQEQEDSLRRVGWTEVIGQDLSVYMDYCWSSFESLKDCSRALETQFTASEDQEDLADSIQTYEEITRLFRNGQLDLWQQSWGGLFVSCLRSLAKRCIAIALFVSFREYDKTIEPGDERLAAEICESLGTYMYSEVSGSQIYGYPMRPLTQQRKREFAEAAAVCFRQSMSFQRRTDEKSNKTVAADWDFLLMIGKCHEKIASTYADEKVVKRSVSGDQVFTRRYEHHMKIALQSYAESLDHGLLLEKDGLLVVDQQGGSGHGATEVQYRLHAVRLKCLFHALTRHPSEHEAAEEEALRLVEEHWHSKSPPNLDGDVRDRSWNVLTDIVDATIQCRKEYSCYHRSVYRHAQALLWAPLICDPSQPEGSLGSVPGSRAYKLRGLNSDSALESAASVIGTLFDRRRAQLCAVWVTQGSAAAYEQINVSVRKYDSLRGKYIAAYIETLELCHMKSDLENFWRWVASSTRDLPSFFNATIGQEPKAKLKPHINECLVLPSRPVAFNYFLADVKRRTNAAIASAVLHEAQSLKAGAKVTENHLKQVYSCFLRLNCELSDLRKSRVRKSSTIKPVIDALVTVYTKFVPQEEQQRSHPTTSGDWSQDAQHTRMIESALEKCREMFPSLSSTFLSTKKAAPKRKRPAQNENESSSQMFRVNVPEGLSEGDTFLTEIVLGETKKRIRLTVPKGGATTLRFTLAVPQKDEKSPSKKIRKVE